MSYTRTHSPISATIRYVVRDRAGWKVTWMWDKKLPGLKSNLTEECNHYHRTREGAVKCAEALTTYPDNITIIETEH